ncbi:hypothetical protein [Rhizobium sp. S9]|uniref:hypothetical protein n=1 Tax=Rhizobium sp. S9 TaxID=2035454 RepID=UPI0011421449|nr:hypothetical protein [Rhizobium sp. S9]
MIERVARAIFAESHRIGNTHGDFDVLLPEVQGVFTKFARAAIEEMREPTAAVQKAMADRFDDGIAGWAFTAGDAVEDIMNTVVDAAFKEDPKS